MAITKRCQIRALTGRLHLYSSRLLLPSILDAVGLLVSCGELLKSAHFRS